MDMTALILEDSKTQAHIIGRMIEAQGWSTVHCEDIKSASESLTQMSVQALFLDVFVGAHNTLLHIDRFRKLARSVPMVLMTAGGVKEAAEETLASARRSGADYVLRKPFNEILLKDVMASMTPDVLAGRKRKHVLVIDDSQTVRSFATRALEGTYRVSQAGSMEEAFNNIYIAHVDLVLCDVFMPGMGGLKGVRTIKQTWPELTVISMSAGIENKVSDIDALNATRSFGADAQLVKPFAARDLLDLTEVLLGRAA